MLDFLNILNVVLNFTCNFSCCGGLFLHVLDAISHPTPPIHLRPRLATLQRTELVGVLHNGHVLLLFSHPKSHTVQRNVEEVQEGISRDPLWREAGPETICTVF